MKVEYNITWLIISRLDDVRIYNRVLTTSEISTLYESDATSAVSDVINASVSTSNIQLDTASNMLYTYYDNKYSMLLQSNNFVSINDDNWNSYSNLTISTWFNVNSNFNGTIFNFTAPKTTINMDYYILNDASYLNNTTSNLIIWYKFDNNNTFMNYGSMGTGYNLNLIFGKAISYITSDKIIGNSSANINTYSTYYTPNTISILTDSFSIAFWAKILSPYDTTEYFTYGLVTIQRNGKNKFTVSGFGTNIVIENSINIDNLWHHYTFIFKKINNYVSLIIYKDGKFVTVIDTTSTWTSQAKKLHLWGGNNDWVFYR